jgi:hypothetical protein
MIRILLIATMLLLPLNIASAKAKKKKNPKKAAQKTTETSDTVDSETTETTDAAGEAGEAPKTHGLQYTNRSEKHVLGAGVQGGFVLGGVTGFGVNVFHPLSPRWQLALEYQVGNYSDSSGKADAETSSDIVSKSELNINLINAYARFFVWESFNLHLGLGQRMIDYSIVVEDKTGDNSIEVSGKASSTNIIFGLGNIWTFGFGLYVGADWIAYMQPVSSTYSSSTKTTGVLTTLQDELAKDGQDLAKFMAEVGTTQLLMVNVGYVF